MLLNTAGQSVGCQMTTAGDGTDFTGTVTVYVTKDNGAQTIGAVGSGICTHEGRGYHSYAPSQAETNAAHIAFTFQGTGAITSSIQIYTRAGDAYTRLGTPAGASVSADIAALSAAFTALGVTIGAINTATTAIKVKTDQMVFGAANALNVNTTVINGALVTGAGTTLNPWRAA